MYFIKIVDDPTLICFLSIYLFGFTIFGSDKQEPFEAKWEIRVNDVKVAHCDLQLCPKMEEEKYFRVIMEEPI